MAAAKIGRTIALLANEYGAQTCKPTGGPLDVLIQTILSQNTSDINSGRAFASLKTVFPTWESVAEAPEEAIAASIKVGGLDKIKAARIKGVLGEIKRTRGDFDLSFLTLIPLDEALEWLLRLPGVGDKTANCVLLFAFCRPALPVDTHIYRVSKRLGLIDGKASVEKAHELLGKAVPPDSSYEFHVLLIEHGRRVCKAQRPRCGDCVLDEICPSCVVV